jgi:hypothetical protein
MFPARRKEAYLALHPETAHGRASPGKEDKLSSLDRYQSEKTGVTERKVQMDAERGSKVSPAAMDIIRGTKLDTGPYLDRGAV